MRSRSRSPWLLGFSAIGVMVACSTPTSPTKGFNGNTASAAVVGTYVGDLTVPGSADLGGLLLLTRASSSASLDRPIGPRWLMTLIDFVQPTVHAQTSASGTLVTQAGPVVPLSGTFSGGTFQVSGGGYVITATVNGTAITGSGSAPGGASAQVAAVTAPVIPSVPANAEGTYRSAFHIDAPFKVRVVRNDNGDVFANCTFPLAIDGQVSISLSREAGNFTGFMETTWSERNVLPGTGFGCPTTAPTHNFGPVGIDYIGPLETLVFAYTDSGISGPFHITRTHVFVGTVTGTTIQGRFWISFHMTGQQTDPPARTYTEGYPSTSVLLTLVR